MYIRHFITVTAASHDDAQYDAVGEISHSSDISDNNWHQVVGSIDIKSGEYNAVHKVNKEEWDLKKINDRVIKSLDCIATQGQLHEMIRQQDYFNLKYAAGERYQLEKTLHQCQTIELFDCTKHTFFDRDFLETGVSNCACDNKATHIVIIGMHV